jgi:hypothetical protein
MGEAYLFRRVACSWKRTRNSGFIEEEQMQESLE